jgi:hypothetical protein
MGGIKPSSRLASSIGASRVRLFETMESKAYLTVVARFLKWADWGGKQEESQGHS